MRLPLGGFDQLGIDAPFGRCSIPRICWVLFAAGFLRLIVFFAMVVLLFGEPADLALAPPKARIAGAFFYGA